MEILEIGSEISCTPKVMLVPSWLGLVEIGSDISSTPDVMAILS
jgi:hypothetical protein